MLETTEKETSTTIVQNSYGRCIAKGEFIPAFYERFLKAHPEVKEKFAKTDFDEQYKLLRHGINLMIMFAADNVAGKAGINRIMQSHSRGRMNIEPKFYSIWKQSLLQTVAEKDRQYTPEVGKAWDEVLEKGIKHIVGGY